MEHSVDRRAWLFLFAIGAIGAIGAGCVSACEMDERAAGLNAPCTRTTDCEHHLTCLQGVCATPSDADAGAQPDSNVSDAGVPEANRAD